MSDIANAAASKAGTIQSVDRALRIFKLICQSDTPLSVISIADALGLNRTTVTGIVNTLVAHRFVEKDAVSGKYVQGIAGFAFTHNYPYRLGYLQSAIAAWEQLSQSYPGLSAHLGLFDGERSVVVISLNMYVNSQLTRSALDLPLHASGLGKCLLAHFPEEERRRIIEAYGLPAFTNATITDPETLEAELADIRQRGYSRDCGESFDNTYCIAFPLINGQGRIVAALSFSSFKEAIEANSESIIRNGLQTSKICSQQLGRNPMKLNGLYF